LHDFYTPDGKFCPVFRWRPLIWEDGFPIRRRCSRAFGVDARIGCRLRGAGTQKMSWAYILSGLVSLALLIYLVVALIRAEDL
jgi:K+-transporting ATPase KdpF subunit